MAERPGPVIPGGGAGSAKRQVSGRKLLLWLGGVAALAVAVFAVIRLVDFGGGESQPPRPPATLPPDPEPPPTTTTTVAATTTTTPPIVEIVDPDAAVAETEEMEPLEQLTAAPVVGAGGTLAEGVGMPPPADAVFLTIRDAGDFTGLVTLQCADYTARLSWHVHPPFAEGEEGLLERTRAPIGDSGYLRVIIDTFVPAEVDPESSDDEAAGDAPPDETTDEAPPEDATADESDEEAPVDEAVDEAPVDEAVDEAPAEEEAEEAAPPEPESVLVLAATNISGRGIDWEGTGEATGIVRHRCPATSLEEFAEWTLAVEGHAEVAWELSFETGTGGADDADETDEAGTGADQVGELLGELADQIFDEEGAGDASGTDQ